MITLRPKQEKFVTDLRHALTQNKRVLGVAHCAFGKTYCFSYIASRVREKGLRIGIGVHRHELVSQVSQSLRQFNVPHGCIISGSSDYSRRYPVQVISVPTYDRMKVKPQFDLVILDEAHHGLPENMWGRFILASPEALTIGVTATPCRLDGRGLKGLFSELVHGPSVKESIADGLLCPYTCFLPPPVTNTKELHVRMGEYKKDEAEAALDKPVVYGDVIGHYRRIADGKRAVAFTVSVKAAHHAAEQFREAGYTAAAIDGDLDRTTRKNMVRDYEAGKINVLTSCSLVDEGFDCPGIEVAIDICPTMSAQLAIQRWGRVMRNAPGKQLAYFLDHVGNMGSFNKKTGEFEEKHGFPDDDREWSLDGLAKTATKITTPRQCMFCWSTSIVSNVCRDCGKQQLESKKTRARVIERVDGELHEVKPEAIVRKEPVGIKAEQAKAKSLPELTRLFYDDSKAVAARRGEQVTEQELQRRAQKRAWIIFNSRQRRKA